MQEVVVHKQQITEKEDSIAELKLKNTN